MRLQLVVTQMAIVRCNALKLMYRVVLGYCEALQSLGVVAKMLLDHKEQLPSSIVAFKHHLHLCCLLLAATPTCHNLAVNTYGEA